MFTIFGFYKFKEIKSLMRFKKLLNKRSKLIVDKSINIDDLILGDKNAYLQLLETIIFIFITLPLVLGNQRGTIFPEVICVAPGNPA